MYYWICETEATLPSLKAEATIDTPRVEFVGEREINSKQLQTDTHEVEVFFLGVCAR